MTGIGTTWPSHCPTSASTCWGLGRRADALPVFQEAVEIRRELVAAVAGSWPSPPTARALSRWCACTRTPLRPRPCHDRPRHDHCGLRLRSSAGSLVAAAEAYPHRFRADLAASLSNLSPAFSELGRPSEALPPAQEAVDICRDLAAAHPDSFRAYLATSLRVLALALDGLGLTTEAETVRRDADLDH